MNVAVLRLDIESLTGKEAIELVDKHDFKKKHMSHLLKICNPVAVAFP